MTAALRASVCALVAQILVQLAWHAWLAPQSRAALALAVLPLLPPLWIARHKPRRGVMVGAIVSLFYFCHGVAEWWSAAGQHVAAMVEIALALAVSAGLFVDARATRRSPR